MGIGLALGDVELANVKAYRDAMEASYEMYYQFKEEMGSTICFEIQEKLLGGSFDFKNDEEAKEWYKLGGLKKCPMVCGIATRITGAIIIDLQKEPPP